MSTNVYVCQQCNLSFNPTAGSHGKFCSLSCSTSFRNKAKKERSIENYSSSPKTCQHCNQQLAYSQRKNKYCSKSCSSKVTNNVPRKRGPNAAEKILCSKVKFILCKHTNKFYLNKNPDGTVRRCSPYIKSIKEKYYASSRFRFNVYNYPEEFDLSLIDQYGWYSCPGKKRKSKLKNIHGISRDHIISISFGFANNIDPKIISHPANCRLMMHSENKNKSYRCDMTIDQLLAKIEIWNKKYTERDNGIEPMTEDWKSSVLPLN